MTKLSKQTHLKANLLHEKKINRVIGRIMVDLCVNKRGLGFENAALGLQMYMDLPANQWHMHIKMYLITCANRPFYSCVLSYLAMNVSEAGVELALIQTSHLFLCKCKLVSIRTT